MISYQNSRLRGLLFKDAARQGDSSRLLMVSATT